MSCRLEPVSLRDGESLYLRMSAPGLAGQQVPVELGGVDDIDTQFVAGFSIELDPDGNGRASVEPSLGRETAVFVSSIAGAAAELGDEPPVAVINPSGEIASVEGARSRREALVEAQEERYRIGLGDPSAAGAREFRVLTVVERLLLTRELKVPGLRAFPLPVRPNGEAERQLTDQALKMLGWGFSPDPGPWHDRYAASQPWVIVVCEPVWATNREEAIGLARENCARMLSLLSLNRGSRGHPVATAAAATDPPSEVGFLLEERPYTGNLIGGFISGEDQYSLLAQSAAMGADPLLALCVRLFGEALAEPSLDSRYLRLWVILETLSEARLLQPGKRASTVLLPDGSPWTSNPRHSTTKTAQPRVYQFVRDHLTDGQIHEGSLVAPAADLEEAVRSWYARRNSTGHAGGSANPAGLRSEAARTLPQPGEPDRWMMSFQEVAKLVLARELHQVGAQLV